MQLAIRTSAFIPELVLITMEYIVIAKTEASSFSAVEIIFDDAYANKDVALDADEFSKT
jgi:hypothetical protein